MRIFQKAISIDAFFDNPALLLPYTITPALLLVVTVCFYPGLMHLLTQHCIFPGVKEHLIDPYYAEHPDEDLEKRKDMGLL